MTEEEPIERLLKKATDLTQGEGWYVGRIDIRGFTIDGVPQHYAYPPSDSKGPDFRIRFIASTPNKALEQAVKFCEMMNSNPKKSFDVELVGELIFQSELEE